MKITIKKTVKFTFQEQSKIAACETLGIDETYFGKDCVRVWVDADTGWYCEELADGTFYGIAGRAEIIGTKDEVESFLITNYFE